MAKPPKLGDSKKEDPWFWNVGRPKAMSEKEEREWQTELNRAKWFRDQAARDHAREEKEILEEEIHQEIKTFSTYALIWTQLANACLSDDPGKAFLGAHFSRKCLGSQSSECKDVKKVIKTAPNNLVMATPALFRLFPLFEEVHPDTEAANRGCVRIHTAPGYQALWEEHYIMRELQQDEQENESVLLQAGPSRSGNANSTHDDKTQGCSFNISSPISSSPTLPLPRSVLAQIALPGGASNPITISVPVLVVVWIKDNARYHKTLVVSRSNWTVCLNEHELELGACGIEVGDELQVYKPTLHRWSPVCWATILGPFTSASENLLLLCCSDVRRLRDFNLGQPIASHIPQWSTKGKGRAV
ncbi:hypothetical protein EST38_g8215 [Candolleomyces aberdarensis]|uniref:Uncharacterized protein n=1 Tax=Candolleomyces aberdarensis TaxID=2316362 RepID=A0A4Q2DF67_9AGAR|nr:hypothetical protein EST38_g8215 [Candolleomyces aberdarensis]